MTTRVRFQDLGGARAMIAHRPHPTVTALERQLAAIGLQVCSCWPDLSPDALAMDFVFFDADMGHDAQFPWAAGRAPMPMIALIGSEAPGRVEWALQAGAHAQLLKPIGDGGAYSALLIARDAFNRQRAQAAEIADLRRRLDERQTVVRAVTLLAARGKTEAEAYAQLRQMAMAWRINFEDAAARIVAAGPNGNKTGGQDDQRSRG